jgi:hypothetical protein
MPEAFRIPLDVIRKLGDGDPVAAHALMSDILDISPFASDPGTVPEHIVSELGNGSRSAGVRVLNKFFQHIRNRKETKSTKAAVHYRHGNADKKCSLCTMYRHPNRCTAVTGIIQPTGLCDLFERKSGHADGGMVIIEGDNANAAVTVDHS